MRWRQWPAGLRGNQGVCVHDDAVAAAALGLVEGVVGGGEEVIEGAAGLAGDGDADRAIETRPPYPMIRLKLVARMT